MQHEILARISLLHCFYDTELHPVFISGQVSSCSQQRGLWEHPSAHWSWSKHQDHRTFEWGHPETQRHCLQLDTASKVIITRVSKRRTMWHENTFLLHFQKQQQRLSYNSVLQTEARVESVGSENWERRSLKRTQGRPRLDLVPATALELQSEWKAIGLQ